jgi:hypothetical protein
MFGMTRREFITLLGGVALRGKHATAGGAGGGVFSRADAALIGRLSASR